MKEENSEMTKSLALNKLSLEFIGYLIFSGVASSIDISVLFLLTEFVGIYYLTSASIAYVFGMITNFTLNRTYNFQKTDTPITKQFPKFFSVAIIGLLLNVLILFIIVDLFSIYYMVAKLMTMFLVMFWSFTGHKLFTFI